MDEIIKIIAAYKITGSQYLKKFFILLLLGSLRRPYFSLLGRQLVAYPYPVSPYNLACDNLLHKNHFPLK